ncbi:MAG: hypothetical protein KatS3mg110_0544 [Pirellulaceae bacterium]|nr:MAG: hypothetical protein KatS3mg110_0544 [Pirellulaceae bacterium]
MTQDKLLHATHCQQRRIRPSSGPPRRARQRRLGVTLVELLIASTVMALIIGALATMATGLRTQQECSQQYTLAMMHARTALSRIEQNCRAAYANAKFPGFVAFAELVGTDSYPDCLVIWRPQGNPAKPTGLPLWNEVVIYGWNPNKPNELLEIRVPNDSSPVPDLTQVSAWLSRLAALRAGTGSSRVVVTDRLRVAQPRSAPGNLRGVIRFEAVLQPSDTQWTSWKAGQLAWTDMSWPRDLYGLSYGVRQNLCRVELQIRPAGSDDPQSAFVFFGSAYLYYPVSPQ